MDEAQNMPPHGPAGASTPPPGPGPKPHGPDGSPAVPVPHAPAGAAPGGFPPAASLPGAVTPATTAPAAPGAETGGRTAISEQAVAKVAAIAARAVPGVHTLGTGSGRTLGAVRDAVAGSDSSATAGVNVEVGETEAAVDITLVAAYGTPLTGIADNVRHAVYAAVEDLVGLNVVEVNVSIADVFIPDPLDNRIGQRQPGGNSQE